jgi:hypothetical protein
VLQQLEAIPVPERAAFIASAAGQELLEEGEEAVRVMRRTPEFVERPSRLLNREAPRPKGVKAAICTAVAAEASAMWNINVSRRMAQRCWDECRSVRRRLAEDAEREV